MPLEPGQTGTVHFDLHTDRFAFAGKDLAWTAEPAAIHLHAGPPAPTSAPPRPSTSPAHSERRPQPVTSPPHPPPVTPPGRLISFRPSACRRAIGPTATIT
ncbi:MAG: fibronectin type III-like domain-contianing protein [Catenulispora sp.]